MGRREYQGAATPTTITSSITNSATSLTLTASTNWPTGVFSAVIDPGLAGEEKILCTSRTGTTVNITTRGYDGTTAASHNAGATIYPVPTAIDFDEANALINTPTTKGDILAATGAGAMARTAVGANTTVLTADSTQANGVKWASPSPATTKGDLVTFDTASARLAVGADGTTLVANSSVATGLSYQPLNSAGKNAIINGGMDIWQRGVSVALPASQSYTLNYTADRWGTGTTAVNQALTISRQPTSDTTNLPNIQYCARVQRNSGQTGTITQQLTQSLESTNSIPLAGKPVTLSFYARSGANYSPASSLLTASVYGGTGTDQNVNAGYTGAGIQVTTNATLTSTWQRFSISGSLTSITTEVAVVFGFTPTGTAGANDYFEITGVQLELGSVATTFSRAGGSIGGELVLCQRYLPVANANSKYFGFSSATTQSYIGFTFEVQPRVAPTGISIPALTNFAWNNASLAAGNPTSITFSTASPDSSVIGVVTTAGTPTISSGLPGYLALGASGYIQFTGCEL